MSTRIRNRLESWPVQNLCALIVATMVVLGLGNISYAQTDDPTKKVTIPTIRPEEDGVIIPNNAPVTPSDGRKVLVNDGTNIVVAKVHVEVGDRLLVILPNGRLSSVKTLEASVTDRPYLPATKEQLTAELTAKFPKFKIRSTKRFLYVYNSSELFYTGTRGILESMYQPMFEYWKRLKVPVHDPDTLLVVIMFQSDKEFQDYRKMPDGVVAYYSGINNQVVMYEQSSLAQVAPDLAVKQAVATVAHEGCHQIFANIGVQQRLSDWPMWISEGLPEYFSPTSLDKGVRWKGVGVVNDMRMKEIKDHLKKNGANVKTGEIFRETIKADALTSTGYAFAWGMTHFLAERKKEKFMNFLADVAKQPTLKPITAAESEALFVKHFGDKIETLERELAQHLGKLPYVDPLETMTHYVCTFETNTRRRVMVTFSPASVKEWQTEQLLSSAGQFNVRTFPNRKLALSAADAWLNSP